MKEKIRMGKLPGLFLRPGEPDTCPQCGAPIPHGFRRQYNYAPKRIHEAHLALDNS